MDEPPMENGPILSRRVIGCAMQVHRHFGCGFLESVYESALTIELRRANIRFARQAPVSVWYRAQVVGEFVADLVVQNELLLELKTQKTIDTRAEAQLLNYLKATGLSVGLVLNFGSTRLQVR